MTTRVFFHHRRHFPLALCRDVIYLIALVCVMSSVRATGFEEMHFMSRFPPSPSSSNQNAANTSSTPYDGQFQDVFIRWIKQVKLSRDVMAITAMVEVAVKDELPTVFWFVNGRAVDETDPRYPQTITPIEKGMLTTINVFRNDSVWTLKLYLHLNVFNTETSINMQDMDSNIDLYPQTILEHGTDVALALTAEEKVTFPPNQDLEITMRFFSEDLVESAFDVQEVILLSGADIFTPLGNPDVLSLRNLTKEEVPSWMHTIKRRFSSSMNRPISPLSLYQILHIDKSVLTAEASLFVSAGFVSNTRCRLFGGQKISRKLELVPQDK